MKLNTVSVKNYLAVAKLSPESRERYRKAVESAGEHEDDLRIIYRSAMNEAKSNGGEFQSKVANPRNTA